MRKIDITDADVCVAGGGMAGLCAALAAARSGCKTVLVQDRPVLGGNASSEIRVHITGADCHGGKPGWRETGIIEEIRLENIRRNPQENYWLWDMILWEFASNEPNLRLLLNTSTFEAGTQGSRIAWARGLQLGSECIYTIKARFYIDCTGDGTLGAEAGAEFRIGREARAEFNESLAPDQADSGTMGHTTPFTAEDARAPVQFVPPAWACRFTDERQLSHRYGHDAVKRGFWWIELGGQNGRHIIHDTPAITEDLWKATVGVWDHIKNHGDHAGATWDLKEVARIPGKRESRRFVGDYILSQKDLDPAAVHDDEVAFGGWPSDLHNVDGFWNPAPAAIFHGIDGVYGIPLRTLYSRNIENLFFAGRNHSATHVAMGSSRVMGTCSVMGQAAGTAAAVCAGKNCTPREAASKHIREIQQKLLRDGAFLPHYASHDSADIARHAAISASSSTPDCPPEKVIDRIARDIPKGERHAWESDPVAGLPAHLELAWQTPRRIREIRLTWDSMLQKELTMCWYPPDPTRRLAQTPGTLARDYRIEAWLDGSWQPLAEIRDNHQRLRVHAIDVETAKIRIVVDRNWCAASARIYEVRCYGEGR